MITVDGVSKSYGATRVLDDVSLTLPAGGVTAMVGPNGAGKSTLLRIMARLLDADSGTVHVGGRDVTTTSSRDLARVMAVLQQDGRVTSRLSVVDLVRFGRFPYSRGKLTPTDHGHVEAALDRMDLQQYRDRFIDELSGGQRQRAHIAMVLAQDTEYVLLDEPLNSLDIRHAQRMMQTLGGMVRELGKTVVVVLHDVNFAAAHADHVVALREGAVVASLPPQGFMEPQVLRDVYDVDVDVVDTPRQRVAVYFS